MFKLSRIDYLRRKVLQDLRDALFGPRYRLNGTTFTVPRGGPPAPRKAIARGTYEKNERDLVQAHLPPDLPAIELGGSFGIVSHCIRKRLSAGQTLVVVEANPGLIETCTGNVKLAGSIQQTHVVNAALAYGAPSVRFALAENIHTSHLVFDDSTGPGIIDVAAVTIESLRATYGINGHFSLVCDIEGAELHLLRHDAPALAFCDMIMMELHPTVYPAIGGTEAEVMERLEKQGFAVVERRRDVIAARRNLTVPV